MIKVVALDVDGVLTDGRKAFDLQGRVISKNFYDRDFLYLKLMREELQLQVVFVSGDDRVNAAIASDRKIPFLHAVAGCDKLDALANWLCGNGFAWDEVCYVGDCIVDKYILLHVQALGGIAAVPANATLDIKSLVNLVLCTKGGDGVVEELYFLLTGSGLNTSNIQRECFCSKEP